MPVIQFHIGSQNFSISCGEGEEAHIESLAHGVNQRYESLRSTFGNAGSQLVMAITMLMMEEDIRKLQKNPADTSVENTKISEISADALTAARDDATAETLNNVSERLEALAKQFETV